MKTYKMIVPAVSFLLGGSVFLWTSCSDNESDAPKSKGSVEIATDWSDYSKEATLPEHYTLRITGTAGQPEVPEQAMTDRTDTYSTDLEVGTYQVLAFNIPENITIAGTTATVACEETGDEETELGKIAKEPGYLFSNARAKSVNIEENLTSEVTIAMKQRVRQLQLTLKVDDQQKEFIKENSFDAILSGVASSVDLITGATSNECSVKLHFTANAERNLYTATVRLLGITGEKQLLSMTIPFKDGTSPSFTSDMTEELAGFGDNIDPKRLNATLDLKLTPGSGNTGTITDWTEGEIEEGNKDVTVDQTTISN